MSLHIGGEIAKNHSLPIDYFVKVSQSLQDLIITLATHNLTNDIAIDKSNFKIEICGFKEGSAIPQFKYAPDVYYTAGVDVIQQRKIVNESLQEIFAITDSGKYDQLKKLYSDPQARNEIVDKIYNYTNSFGTSPASVVNYKGKGKFVPLFKHHKLKAEIKKNLQVQILETNPEEVLHETAVGKIKITKRQNKTRKKISEVYSQKDTLLSYKVNEIIHEESKYILHTPFMSSIEKEDNFYVINSELLGITGTGEDEAQAKKSFAQEFDYIYKRYNELNDKQCSARILRVKKIINALVVKVEKI